MTARVRRWLSSGALCAIIGVVLFCTGHGNTGPVALSAALLCWLCALAHWDAGYQRRRLERLRLERRRADRARARRLREHGRS